MLIIYFSKKLLYPVKSPFKFIEFPESHGCKPWPLGPTQNHHTLNKTCIETCRPQYTERTYAADKRSGTNWTYFEMNDVSVEQIVQREIMARGSVVLKTQVYDTYFQYSSGVYQRVAQTDGTLYDVILRLQGWGVDENGLKYWKAVAPYGPNVSHIFKKKLKDGC